MDTERLKPIIEAAVLASTTPLSIAHLAELFDEAERPTPDQIAQALHALREDCAQRGVELVEVASGFRFQIKADVFQHLTGLWTERQSRYSRALLETLSLIAYRQPITRGEIEQIRGVAVATSILRTLEEREWVRIVGHRDVPGKPALYGTTRAFLDYFQLRSLDELPPLSALRDLEALEPELALDIDAPPMPVSPELPEDDGNDDTDAADESIEDDDAGWDENEPGDDDDADGDEDDDSDEDEDEEPDDDDPDDDDESEDDEDDADEDDDNDGEDGEDDDEGADDDSDDDDSDGDGDEDNDEDADDDEENDDDDDDDADDDDSDDDDAPRN